MSMKRTLQRLYEVLSHSLISDADPKPLWHVGTIYNNPPLAMTYSNFPFAILQPSDNQRLDQYVQEDTAVNPVTVWLFPEPIQRATLTNSTAGDLDSASNPNNKLIAMVDRVVRIIRDDPTLGLRADSIANSVGTLQSDIYDTQILGSNYRQPSFVAGGEYHAAEVRLQVKRREPWRLDGEE